MEKNRETLLTDVLSILSKADSRNGVKIKKLRAMILDKPNKESKKTFKKVLRYLEENGQIRTSTDGIICLSDTHTNKRQADDEKVDPSKRTKIESKHDPSKPTDEKPVSINGHGNGVEPFKTGFTHELKQDIDVCMTASIDREAYTPPRELLTSWLARLYRHRLTTTTGGNLSVLEPDGTMYITPSGGDKAIVPPQNIAFRRPQESKFEGPAPPSMEWPLHTAAYSAKPDARAVLHAHSMALIAFSLADVKGFIGNGEDEPRIPNTMCLLSAWQACGKVAFAPYAIPGSMELAGLCKEAFLTGADCVILQNHGVVVVGKTLHQAYDRFVSLEYLAQSIVNATPLQRPIIPLPRRILKYAIQADDIDHKNPFPRQIPCRFPDGRVRGISTDEKVVRASLCKYIKRAYDQNLITSSSGSFSVRQPSDAGFVITPTDVDRRNVEPRDLCYLNMEGELVYCTTYPPGSPDTVSPSRAARLHATIYRAHPDISCIMIVQPTYATAYCTTGTPFDSRGMPESHVILHDVQAISLEDALKDDGARLAKAFDIKNGKTTVMVYGYGIVTVGTDLLKTFIQVEVLESMCGVSLQALRRGPLSLLSAPQVDEIDKVFGGGH